MDTHHWYDGVFYDRCIAPNQDRLFAVIRGLVRPGEKVLDVGCGTGRLVFQLGPACSEVLGVDPSAVNIRRARAVWGRNGRPDGVRFHHGTVDGLGGERFDSAVISMVLHEVDERARVPLLHEVRARAARVIVADYRVPRIRGVMDAATEVVEFLAGRDHYRGFRSFVRRGGLTGLLSEAGIAGFTRVEGVPLPAEAVIVAG